MRTTPIIFILILNWTFLIAQSPSIDSLRTNENLISNLKKQFTLTEYDDANIVMPFNKDTILIAGYLSDFSVVNSPKNVVYRTINGGRTWELIKFKGDACIYNSHYQTDGKVWMGGSDEYIHFSNDFGKNWIAKPKPLKPINRVLSVYMTDSLKGIAGGLDNGLAITNDNWQSTLQIPTPLDQKKFTIIKNSARGGIDKIAILDSFILKKKNDHIYYSKLSPVAWKEFNIPVSDFSVDILNKQFSIYSLGNKVYTLSSKLASIRSYIKPSECFTFAKSKNTSISFADFFSSEKIILNIKAVKFNFDKMSGGCLPHSIYKENIKEMKVNDTDRIFFLKEILTTTDIYSKPLSQSFTFTEQDFVSYMDFYNQTKKNRKEEKVWGGDFTSLLNIEGKYFISPKQAVTNLSQSLLDSVYKTFSFNTSLVEKNEPYIILTLVNSMSDTLKITSKNSYLFSLPWTIEYKGEAFQTYDTRFTQYLRTLLPKHYNYYDKLFAGELIYRLLEQRTINELKSLALRLYSLIFS
jgi:hypothetical protein